MQWNKATMVHVLVWLSGYIWLLNSGWTVDHFRSGQEGFWIVAGYGTLLNIFIFYLHADYIIPRFLSRNTWWQYLLMALIVLLGISSFESLLDQLFIQYYPLRDSVSFQDFFQGNILMHLIFCLFFSFVYRTSKDWWVNEQQKQTLKAEKLTAELAYLKAQVSPHFLFNTLNNLFASAQKSDDQDTANGIAKLANMMRYMLTDSKNEKVTIEQEINYLQDFIDLQTMRICKADPVKVNFNILGSVNNQVVAPLLLIPFVENAFKHGISLNEDSFINIDLKLNKNDLEFLVSNSKHQQLNQEKNTGVGLENVQRRLALLYPDQHRLKIEESKKEFSVHLCVIL